MRIFHHLSDDVDAWLLAAGLVIAAAWAVKAISAVLEHFNLNGTW